MLILVLTEVCEHCTELREFFSSPEGNGLYKSLLDNGKLMTLTIPTAKLTDPATLADLDMMDVFSFPSLVDTKEETIEGVPAIIKELRNAAEFLTLQEMPPERS